MYVCMCTALTHGLYVADAVAQATFIPLLLACIDRPGGADADAARAIEALLHLLVVPDSGLEQWAGERARRMAARFMAGRDLARPEAGTAGTARPATLEVNLCRTQRLDLRGGGRRNRAQMCCGLHVCR